MRSLFDTLLVLALLPGLASAQQPAPVGGDFQVNTYTFDSQFGPNVSPYREDGFVVTWGSMGSSGTDSSSNSIQGQRFSADGEPKGREFQVNTYTTGSQTGADVAPLQDGGFVVTWNSVGSYGTDSSSHSIQGQRYASNGSPVDDQFQVNTYTSSFQAFPAVSPDGSGGVVVTWHSDGSSGTDSGSTSIQGRRYTRDGSPDGEEFQINTNGGGAQQFPAVTSYRDGGFVVVWQSDLFAAGAEIRGQRYTPDGLPAGGEFPVNTYTTSSQSAPSVSSDGADGFVVTWTSFGSSGTDASSLSIQGQRYAPDASPAGGEFQVNTYTTSAQFGPAVSPDGTGGFIVIWSSLGSPSTDSSDESILAQRYASDGSPRGGEFQVNTYTTSRQLGATVGPGRAGAVVTWHSDGSNGTDSSFYSVQGRLLAPPDIFRDSFESGDTSAWSMTVP